MAEPKTFPEIATRIRAVRFAFSELNQRDFAAQHGFNQDQYNTWERGRRRIPIEAAEKLTLKYGLSLDWLYLGRVDGLSSNARAALFKAEV